MKIIRNDEIYIPIYRAKNEIFDEDYDNLLKLYQKSFKVQSKDFQSLYDCLSIQLMYWLSDFEEERDPKMMDRLLFEIKGLDFYRFFYNDLEWYPYLILDKHDGRHYFFINDKNYKRVMLYMNELVNFLNDAYKDLKLTEIEII